MNPARLTQSERFMRLSAILKALPGPWSLVAISPTQYRAIREDGYALILIHFDAWPEIKATPAAAIATGQIFTLADWGLLPFGSTTPSLSLSMTKPNALIAAELQRCLISPFEHLLPQLARRRAWLATSPAPDAGAHVSSSGDSQRPDPRAL